MKTKKGMASLYLVAFTTLLLGIVTMSFARVMISESREASNSDLSQSAFDSALAGIEDAKTVLMMYQKCLNGQTNVNGQSCDDIKTKIKAAFENGNCDAVQQILGKNDKKGEVFISEELDQAYTCVPIANDSPTYESVLNEDSRSRIIPVKIEKDADGNDQHAKIVGIELRWYTPDPDDDDAPKKYMTDIYENTSITPLGTKNDAQESIPILNFELFQTDETFTMAELDLNNENNTGTDHAMIMLYPNEGTTNGEYGTFVSKEDLLNASNKSKEDQNVAPKQVSCGYKEEDGYSEHRCRTTIQFPATYNGGDRAEQTFMFKVSLPYGVPQTDFSIKPCTKIENDHCTEYAGFTGVQYIIDSTGRASTLYRRIIARVETLPAGLFPEYAVQVSGDNSTTQKNFWVTRNCWMTDGKGNSTTCANNGG